MKKAIAAVLLFSILSCLLLVSCGGGATTKLTIKVTTYDATTRQSESLITEELSVSGKDLTVMQVIDYLNNQSDNGFTRELDEEGEITSITVNGTEYANGNEPKSETVTIMREWFFKLNDDKDDRSDYSAKVANGDTLNLYFSTWEYDTEDN